jgi:hypothetical protein
MWVQAWMWLPVPELPASEMEASWQQIAFPFVFSVFVNMCGCEGKTD